MLFSCHGALKPANVIRKLYVGAMTSVPGTCLALDATRPNAAVMARKPLGMMENSSQKLRNVWHPSHGIVFGNNPSTAAPNAARELSTISYIDRVHEKNLALQSQTQQSCILSNSPEPRLCNTGDSVRGLQGSTGTSESSWTASTGSQESKQYDITRESRVLSEETRDTQEMQGDNIDRLHRPLAFRVAKDALQKAKDAAPGTKESYWSYKLYMGPEGQGPKVHYCRSKDTTERVAKYFLDEKVIGFDIEWKPDSSKTSGIKNNISLLQLASETRIGLFHIAAFSKDTVSDLVAPTLKKIMEDDNITKVGVAIKADCTRLRNFLEIDSKGIFELSHLYKLVKYSSSGDVGLINKKLVSLTTQVEEYLELPVFKGEVRGSDWTQPLTIAQIVYAASDAYANFMLYDALEGKRKLLKSVPPRPYHAELNLPIRLASGALIPAAEEGTEDMELEANPTAADPTIPASAFEAIGQNVQIEDDPEPNLLFSNLRHRNRIKSTGIKTITLARPKVQALIDAETWVLNYRASTPFTSSTNSASAVTFSALRVYSLWYNNPSLSITEIASLLRTPPLQKSTVGAYILDSIRLEKLPYETGRLKDILQMVPESRNLWRYKSLWKLVD